MMFSGTCWSGTHGYDTDAERHAGDDDVRAVVDAQHDAGLL